MTSKKSPKDRFYDMFFLMPEKARKELVYNYAKHPMSMNVCCFEIMNDTKKGKEILERLGFEE